MADELHDDDLPAEPIELRRFDMHGAWRVLLWGASAAMAVAIVAGTAFSDIGAERLKETVAALWQPLAADPMPSQAAQVAQNTPAVTAEQFAAVEKRTRELAQTVRDLAADRDRLRAKLASLEQNLGDITGAVSKQSAQTGQLAAQLAAQMATSKHDALPPPLLSAPQTVAAMPSPAADPAAPAPDTPITTATTPPTVEAAPPIDGPIPLPPMRTAAIEETAAVIRELGVEVGGAASLDALRAHWSALKANVGPDIVGLSPSFVTQQKPGGANDYRLVLGPLPNTAAAFQLCTKLVAARVTCRAGTFSVQRLANAAPMPKPAARQVDRLQPAAQDSIMVR